MEQVPDIVYGIFVNDELKLNYHRTLFGGVMHRHIIAPLDPKPGDDVTIYMWTPGKLAFTHAALYYTTDGTTPAGSRGAASNGITIMLDVADVKWDVIIWDYVMSWQAVIPGQPDSTAVQYVISAWSEDGDEVYADTPNVDDTLVHGVMLHYENIPADTPMLEIGHFPYENVFHYHVDTLKAPDWADSAVIYQIFIDRFHPGDGKEWIQTSDLEALCGGTLWGVRDKLDYLADLGVNCLWLSPTWDSPSFHGYDIRDYTKVNERLGGEEALRAVIEGAHARGMRVLLDMACNHTSNEHPYFLDTMNNPNSPYRDWFFLDERVKHGYKSFFNVKTMPRINLSHPDARNWMVENFVMWVRDFDIDGYRLDVADGPGPNFWGYVRHALRKVKPDTLIFGEIIDLPERLRTYAGRLDGNLDFPLTIALRETYAHQRMTETQLASFIRNNDMFYPADFVRPVFLDNHDMNRFSYIARDDNDRLKRAALHQLSLPGPAIIYCGTETGIGQNKGVHQAGFRDIRRVMNWDRIDDDLLAFYKEAIHNRNARRIKADPMK